MNGFRQDKELDRAIARSKSTVRAVMWMNFYTHGGNFYCAVDCDPSPRCGENAQSMAFARARLVLGLTEGLP